MLRLRRRNRSKRAMTLVELVVAMTLTTIFACSCVMLIYPVTRIYTHANELSRAQLVADTVIDALRNECANTFIKEAGDVYIINADGTMLDGEQHDFDVYGNMLVIRKTKRFYETLGSNYAITATSMTAVSVFETDSGYTPQTLLTGRVTSRSVYEMFPSGSSGTVAIDAQMGYVHFGFLEKPSGSDALRQYDYTNPFGFATYRDYSVSLNFHEPVISSYTGLPAYVICDVSILNANNSVVYTRTVVLCFASPVVQ